MGAVIAWKNAAEEVGVALSVDSEAGGLGVRNLLTPQIADIWRSGPWGGATINLRVDLGAVLPDLRLLALAAPRDGVLPASSSTIRVTGSAVALDDAEAFDVAGAWEMRPFGLWAHVLDEPVAARWVRFELTGPDAYLQLGRLWCGPALVTSRSINYGWGRSFAEGGSGAAAAISGVRWSARGAVMRTVQFDLANLAEADATALDAVSMSAGNFGQVYAAPREDQLGAGLFGRLTTAPGATQPYHNLFSARIAVEEDA